MSSTYYSASKGQTVDMSTMHPAHLINALNKQVKEMVALGEPFQSEQLQLIGELAVTLVQKGCLLDAVVAPLEIDF